MFGSGNNNQPTSTPTQTPQPSPTTTDATATATATPTDAPTTTPTASPSPNPVNIQTTIDSSITGARRPQAQTILNNAISRLVGAAEGASGLQGGAAVADFLGDNTHTIYVGTSSGCNGGERNCNEGNLTSGASVLLNLGDLLSDGEGLPLHELGHTLTNGNVNGINYPDQFNRLPGIYNPFEVLGQNLSTSIALNNIPNTFANVDNWYETPSEVGADFFAYWVLGQNALEDAYELSPHEPHLMAQEAYQYIDEYVSGFIE